MATLTNLISNATGNVGIGTTSTDAKLQVYSTTGTTQIFNQLQLTNMGVGNNGDIVGIGFAAGESTQYGVKGSIGFVRTTSYGRGDITFYTNNTAANESVSTSNERMRITSDGSVLIGVNGAYNSSRLLQVKDGLLIGNSFYTYASIDTSGTADLILTANANPANLGANTNIIFKHGTSAGGGPVERMRIVGDGNVGIGTSSPSTRLHVYSDANQPILIQGTTAGTWMDFQSSTSNLLSIGADGTRGIGFYNRTTAADLMTISNGGNVGIGTNSPIANAKLNIVSATDTFCLINATSATQGNRAALFMSACNVNGMSGTVSIEAISVNNQQNDMVFRTGGNTINVFSTERMRIDTTGNVGIGTASPSDFGKLAVYGNIAMVNNAASGAETNRIQFYNIGAATYQIASIRAVVGAGQANRGEFGFYVNNGASEQLALYIDRSQNIGIGTTSPLERITFASSDSIIARSSATDFNSGYCSRILFNQGGTGYGYLGFYTYQGGTGGGERMRIAENGNVGIGTTSPATKLEVYGVVRVSESSSGGILQLTAGASAIDIASTFYGGSRRPITFTMDGEKVRIAADGNVGIGTSSPSATLNVRYDNAGASTVALFENRRSVAGSPDDGQIVVGSRGYNNTILRQNSDQGTNAIGSTLDTVLANTYSLSGYGKLILATQSTARLTIDTAGNVGIGTTSPTSKLDIASTQGNGIVMRYDTSTAYQAWIRPYWNSGTDTRIDFAINRTANVTPDVIMSVGYGSNVGIGTTSPASKLHISGSGQTIMRLDSSTTTNISQFMVKANTDGVLIMGMSGGSAASTNYGVTAAGQAYIGTTTLSTVHPTSLVIGNVSTIPIIFSTNNTEKARITSGGSLLVGTTVAAANTAGTAVATNFKGINAYEFNNTTGRGSTQGISWNYLINTTHIIDISPGDTVIAFIDVRLAAYSSSGSGYANSLFCYGGHVGAYNITTVFNVVNGNVSVSAAIVSDKLRITITIANTGQSGECVLTVTDANKNGTLSTIVHS